MSGDMEDNPTDVWERDQRKSDAFSVRMRASGGDEHVSGAETIVTSDGSDAADMSDHTDELEAAIAGAADSMIQRALNHPRGDPDEVTVTVERLSRPPRRVEALPVVTINVDDADEGRRMARKLLLHAGVSDNAITRGFDVLQVKTAKRGAALVDAADGSRLDPDPARGVRASYLGASDSGQNALDAVIMEQEVVSPRTVREAVVLATTIAHTPGTRAELCWSDDPDYDAGYVATPDAYYRLPTLKPGNVTEGGRTVFVEPDKAIGQVVKHLERQPMLVDGAAGGEEVKPGNLLEMDTGNPMD
ncbi:6-carboxyhexanoate--CoA ligase [Halarchaeum sp. P4]|uniref:6-carboxyhexanoate--CoA ligase n=1 Tax=Halarchaeum sp. P4 TaxID=3421639 RepID=UPI003EBA58E6